MITIIIMILFVENNNIYSKNLENLETIFIHLMLKNYVKMHNNIMIVLIKKITQLILIKN